MCESEICADTNKLSQGARNGVVESPARGRDKPWYKRLEGMFPHVLLSVVHQRDEPPHLSADSSSLHVWITDIALAMRHLCSRAYGREQLVETVLLVAA